MSAQEKSAAAETPVAAAPPAGAPGLLDDVAGLARELQALAHDQLQLVALEAKLAGRALVMMIAAGVGFGILVASVWLSIMAGMVWSLIAVGIAPAAALLAMALLNVAAAGACYRAIRRGSRRLRFPATLRSFASASERRSGA
jgi:hypothetical protein